MAPHQASESPRKRALLAAIQRVRRKVGSKFGDLADLEFAHRDAKDLYNCLMVHGYQAGDIVLMIDDVNHPEHLWPTRRNILRQIDLLVSNVPEDCHFFFYFSGHGLEEEVHGRAHMRANGRDSEIISADGKPVLDHILHDRLITPLEKVKGSKLIALLDCCHSESLLDLQKGDGPNRYSRAWTIGAGQLFKDVATVIVNLLRLSKQCRKKYQNAPWTLRRASTKWRSPPVSRTHEVGELSVICLSACRDGQEAHDDRERGQTFTKCFLDAMASRSGITWSELRDTLKELVSDIQEEHERYLQEPLAGFESDESLKHWTQEPRCSTSSHTDLTKKVTL